MTVPLPERQLAVVASMEDYATAFAYVVHLKDEDGALELLSVSREDWRRARVWDERLSEEVREGGDDLGRKYARAFSAARARLRATDQAAAAVVEAPRDAEQELAAPAPADLSPGRISDGAAKRPDRALAAAPLPALAAAGAPTKPTTPAQLDLDRTAELSDAPRAKALPFTAGGSSLLATPGGERAPVAHSGATAELFNVPLGKALPFTPGGPSPLATRGGERAPVDHGGASLAPKAACGAAPPFDRAAGPLAIDQYASLVTNLERFPDKASLILERYGLGHEDLAAVHAGFRARFAADAALHAEFSRKVEELRKRLTEG